MICDMSIPESFLCQFLDLSQSLIFLHLGLIQNSLFWFSWDWSQNHFFDSSWTYPYVLVLLVLGLIPESNFREFWDFSQSYKKKPIGSNPRYYLYKTLGLIPKPSFLHIWISPRYSLYMTLGLIPMSHFLTARTDPNVTFGLCSKTRKYHKYCWSKSTIKGVL